MANIANLAAKKGFPETLEEACGIITSACKILGVSRETYRQWCIQDPEFKAACEKSIKHGREAGCDLAESSLLRNIKEGKETSCFGYLNTYGKDRGWGRQEEKTNDSDDFKRRVLSILTDDQLKALLTDKSAGENL